MKCDQNKWSVNTTIHHQVYTDLKFIGKCDYIKLPSHYLWDTTSLQQKFLLLLLLVLQSLMDLRPFHNCPLLFLVLQLMSAIPYPCKLLFMLGCLCCFHPVSSFRKFSRYKFFMGWGCQPHAKPPTCRTRLSHFVWDITLTCLAWEALTVAMVLPAQLSGSFDHVSPTATSKYDTFSGWTLKYKILGCVMKLE